MKITKERFILFIVTFIINLFFIFLMSIVCTSSIDTLIKFSSYQYDYACIFDNLDNYDDSYTKTKSFYSVKTSNTAYAYLFFEKNVLYNISPNVNDFKYEYKNLYSNECAISYSLAKLLNINVEDTIKIDINNIEYNYKVKYLYNTDYSFYDSKVKDIYSVVLGNNESLSDTISCHDIIFCREQTFNDLINDERYSLRSIFLLKDELIFSFLRNFPIIIFILILVLIDIVTVNIIFHRKYNDFILNFYSSFKICKINKEYAKYYMINHLFPCLAVGIFTILICSNNKAILILSCIYMIIIILNFIFNYGGFRNKWKKNCYLK